MEVEESLDERRTSDTEGLLADDDSGSSGSELLSCEDKIKRAIDLKQHGNALLIEGKYAISVSKYEEGLNLLPSGDADELRLALLCNMALCYIKMKEWRKCVEAADKALAIDSRNTKALYRRGYSLIRMLKYEKGKKDLTRLLEIDKDNTEAKKEIHQLNKKRQAQKEMDKKSFGGLFDKNCNLYADYEMEMAARKERDEEELKKRRNEWENESDKAEARGEKIDDFDEWNRKRCEKENEDKVKYEEVEKSKKEVRKSSTKPPSAKDNEAIEYDEDISDLMGEKKLSYCYFDRKPTGDEKMEKDRFKPIQIDDSSGIKTKEKINALSDWNAGGTTWEEKDISGWSCKLIEEKLSNVCVKSGTIDLMNNTDKLLSSMTSLISNDMDKSEKLNEMAMDLIPMEMKVTKVVSVSGDASLAVIRGSKRYLYDFEIVLEWKADIGDPKDVMKPPKDMKKKTYKGKLSFTDVSSNQSVGERKWSEAGRLTYKEAVPTKEFISAMYHISSKFREAIAAEVDGCVKHVRTIY